jgi:hypothetical protein
VAHILDPQPLANAQAIVTVHRLRAGRRSMAVVSPPRDRCTVTIGGALAGRKCGQGHGSGTSSLSPRGRVD